MNSNYLAIILSSLILLMGCGKERLTKATQHGANTMSCKINGVVHVAQSSWGNPAVSAYFDTDKYFRGGANMYKGSTFICNLSLNVYGVQNVGIYPISKRFNYASLTRTSGDRLVTEMDGIGFINITYYNKTERIVAGRFEFIAKREDNPADSVVVTDGRFDLKW